jgi:ribonucleoside-diphosphate reductase alpha subunit
MAPSSLLCLVAFATRCGATRHRAAPRRALRFRGGADAVLAFDEDVDAVAAAAPEAPVPAPAAAAPSPLAAKLLKRVASFAGGLDGRFVDPARVVAKALAGAASERYDAVDATLAETAAYMATEHPDYGALAARLALARLHEATSPSLREALLALDDEADVATGEPCRLLDDDFRAALRDDAGFVATVEAALQHGRDFEGLDYFGFKTLERSYLLRHRGGDAGGGVAERPQHLFMRAALGIHRGWLGGDRLARSLETYELLSTRLLMHASPTLFHAGLKRSHLSSCFLLGSTEDSIEGIYRTLGRCAAISKAAGGIGLSASDIRATGSRIRGTGGESNGLVPVLRVFDATARYVDQGGGKRPGAFAVYIEPWHADIFDVLDLKKNHGKEERRARDLFYGLWIPDLFMRRVADDGDWSLFCPDECPGLTDATGEAFDELYARYEAEGKARKTLKARKVWRAVLDAQMETGTPYMLYKDACNAKSNHRHLGPIKCSNLCCEIVEYSGGGEIAVCNLGSLVLPHFVRDGQVDFDELKRVAGVLATNLDATIDSGHYPDGAAEASNLKHRPVGIGVSGLADAFALLRLPFDSPEAAKLNEEIFEAVYFGALEASCLLARSHGPYASYEGSPASEGLLQPDLWGADRGREAASRWDWLTLRRDVDTYGLRNSLLTAPMPTASTAQIVGVNECFEPYTSNLYARRVKAGEFVVANRHLVEDLARRGLWDDAMRRELLKHGGSVLPIGRIPDDVKALYKTAWELSQKTLVDLSAGRGKYIDQSQSLNCFIGQPDYAKLTTYHFHGWKAGLKTGMYYLRTQPAASALQFTLDADVADGGAKDRSQVGCGADVCLSCSG